MSEFRIEYTIQRAHGDDWVDVGFGSSGAWDSVNEAVHMVDSDVQNRGWETELGMPDPRDLEDDAS